MTRSRESLPKPHNPSGPEWRALHLAIQKDDSFQLGRILADKTKAYGNGTYEGESALHWAIKYRSFTALLCLLREPSIDLCLQDASGATPMLAAAKIADEALAKSKHFQHYYHRLQKTAQDQWMFIEVIARNRPYLKGAQYEEALFFAVKHQQINLARQLLEAGASPHAGMFSESTCLQEAIRQQSMPMMSLLLAFGARARDENSRGEDAYHALNKLPIACQGKMKSTLEAEGLDYKPWDLSLRLKILRPFATNELVWPVFIRQLKANKQALDPLLLMGQVLYEAIFSRSLCLNAPLKTTFEEKICKLAKTKEAKQLVFHYIKCGLNGHEKQAALQKALDHQSNLYQFFAVARKGLWTADHRGTLGKLAEEQGKMQTQACKP